MIINFNMMGLDAYGGTRVVLELANGLSDKGHEVIITSPKSDVSWFGGEIKAKPNMFTLPNCLAETGLKLYAPDCDINVATYYPTVKPTLASRKGIPFYLIQHYDPLFIPKSEIGRAVQSYMLPIRKVCVSRWLQETIRNTTGHDVGYIGNGINPICFHSHRQNKSNSRTVMFFSRNQEWKGTKEAKAAIKLLKNVSVIEITPDKRLNDRNIADLYRDADVFLFTSHYEGFGLPPLEAMSCGTPVVTTDCIGVNEYAVNMYNSLVVKRDSQQLADAINQILDNPDLAENLRIGGLETAKHWNFKNVVDKLEKEFYESIKSN